MKKELPKMYHSTIGKNINNVQNIYSSINDGENIQIRNNNYNKFDIEKKINNIFPSHFVA